jgi:diadenosine tetraphosphate (Ap4A) HIT family hydrolase
MLMMVDANVHFHVFPRYSETRKWNGLAFPDLGWPGPPRLDGATKLDADQVASMVTEIALNFR